MYFYLPCHLGLHGICEVHAVKNQSKFLRTAHQNYGLLNKILMPYDKNLFGE